MPKPFEPQLEVDEVLKVFDDLEYISGPMSGGEGTVFKAFKKSIDKYVAVKIYAKDHLKARTELEVKKLSNINSPHLVDFYENGEINIRGDTCYYTETTFIEGQDLKKILESEGRLSEQEVINLIKCMSKAIDSLWEQRVVHCDIKPENIMKSDDGNFVLIDLGIAKHLDVETMTKLGTIMGTIGYLAPEQFKGRKNITLRADYYALGIVAVELLTGLHPFNKNQHAMISNNMPPIQIDISENLKKLLYSLTSITAYKRPRSFEDVKNILEG